MCKVIHTMGCNNCGGRCIIDVHLKDGVITQITTDLSEGSLMHPPLTACARGFHYPETYLGENRLHSPLLRAGKRGSGQFKEISWEEAVELITKEWIRIRDTYGPESRYVQYGWGVSAAVTPIGLAKRLLSLDGGFLDYYNSYSTACTSFTTPFLYGTKESGNSYEDLLNTNLIILWGHNPQETRFDSLMFYLKKAKEKGIPIVCVDPRFTDTAKVLNAEWIPIRPTTDAAFFDAMAYVIVKNDLYDKDFVTTSCQGFTRENMPEGYEEEENYFDYLFGRYDGIEKTPEWAADITGTPAAVIEKLAIRYAKAKPGALIQGYGPQRNFNGEQTVRGGIALACLTGNVGISGGWACGAGNVENPPAVKMPKVKNPYSAKIPVFTFLKAVEDGKHMGKKDGVRNAEGLKSDIKMILNLAGNALINQHGDINRSRKILEDTDKCEFIVTSDLFLTPSAMISDLVLPAVSFLEMNNITSPWVCGDFIGRNNKVVEPLSGCRFEYDWLKEVAKNLGLYDKFTEGHETVDDWLKDLYEKMRSENDKLPSYEKFVSDGIYRYEDLPVKIAFKEQRENLSENPFKTPSGKVEIFSPSLFERKDERIPGIPKYVAAVEGFGDPLMEKYPYQLVGYHTKRRCHSIHDSNKNMEILDPQALHISRLDAEKEKIKDHDLVVVFNDRGKVEIEARVDDTVMPGVLAMPQGAWYTPGEDGMDKRGCINVLTSQNPTPLAKGNSQHTILVQIEKM